MSRLKATGKIKASFLFIVSAALGCFVLFNGLKAKPQDSLPFSHVTPAAFSAEPIQPISVPTDLDVRKVQLGRELFHDKRLSANNSVSCASCHDLQTGGVDGRKFSVGIFHRQGARNAPTVFNSGLNYRQFWDAHAATLEEQIDGPLQAKAEMGANWQDVVTNLRQDLHYAAEFARIYSERIAPETIRDAIAVFERSLVTPNCRFDHYLKGDRQALTSTELAGYRLFKSLGCVSCHQGRNVGGGMMQPFGVLKLPILSEKETEQTTRRETAKSSLYRVPPLRNVAQTAPYFHNGSADTLPKAVRIMSDVQLCRRLSDAEVEQIVAFLQTLTGTYEGKPL